MSGWLEGRGWRLWSGISLALVVSCGSVPAQASDGAYGRLAGDLALAAQVGATAGQHGVSACGRLTTTYLQSGGLYFQYNDGLGFEGQVMARSLAAGFEIRPFFIGRFVNDLERGPALLDLLVDSLSLGLGLQRSWHNPRFCKKHDGDGCAVLGMEVSVGLQLSLLPRANSPFIALHGAYRWSQPTSSSTEQPPPQALLTLTLGYQHLLNLGLVDAGDGFD